MPWIHRPPDDASEALARLTAPWRRRGVPVANVIAILKVAPRVLASVLEMNDAITFGGSTLGRRREELIATTVSAMHECFY